MSKSYTNRNIVSYNLYLFQCEEKKMNVFVKIKAKFFIIFVILLLFPLHLKCQDTTEATTEKEEDTTQGRFT